MATILPMTTPKCTCCARPETLIARPDLGEGVQLCVATGESYQISRGRVTRVPLRGRADALESVRVDLSRTSYS